MNSDQPVTRMLFLFSTRGEVVAVDRAVRAADIVMGLVNHRVFQRLLRNALDDKAVVEVHGTWR